MDYLRDRLAKAVMRYAFDPSQSRDEDGRRKSELGATKNAAEFNKILEKTGGATLRPFDVDKYSYDPSEKRDEKGEWTSGSVSSSEVPNKPDWMNSGTKATEEKHKLPQKKPAVTKKISELNPAELDRAERGLTKQISAIGEAGMQKKLMDAIYKIKSRKSALASTPTASAGSVEKPKAKGKLSDQDVEKLKQHAAIKSKKQFGEKQPDWMGNKKIVDAAKSPAEDTLKQSISELEKTFGIEMNHESSANLMEARQLQNGVKRGLGLEGNQITPEQSAKISTHAQQLLRKAMGLTDAPASDIHEFEKRLSQRGIANYAKQSGSWITINSHEGEDGKKHGGTPIQVNGEGKITAGPPSLKAEHLSSLKDHARKHVRAAKGEHAKAAGKSGKDLSVSQAEALGTDRKVAHHQAAKNAGKRTGVAAHKVMQVMSQSHRFMIEQSASRELAKSELRKNLGLTANDLRNLENVEGGDHSSIKNFDTAARDTAGHYPELGINPEDHDTPAKMYDLLREGKQKHIAIHDQEVADMAEEWLKGSKKQNKTDDREPGQDDDWDEPIHPRSEHPSGKRAKEVVPFEKRELYKKDADGNHEFSSTQIQVPKELADKVKAYADLIPDSELAEDGRENDIHITCLFGLHTNNVDDVKETVYGQRPIHIKLGKLSLFQNPDADVLKIEIDSPELHELNKNLRERNEHTSTHPSYKPHCTLAYLKPGEGKKYSGSTWFDGESFTADSLMFSDKKRDKTEIYFTNETEDYSKRITSAMARYDKKPVQLDLFSGESRSAKKSSGGGNYDESKHPRDETGKYVEKGSTSKSNDAADTPLMADFNKTEDSPKSDRPHTYRNGDRAEYTGKMIDGMHEVEIMEGRKKGQMELTARGPDGKDPYAEHNKSEYETQQAEFRKLRENQESVKPIGVPGQQRGLFSDSPDGQKKLFDYVAPKKSDQKKAKQADLLDGVEKRLKDALKGKATLSPADIAHTVIQESSLPGQGNLFS